VGDAHVIEGVGRSENAYICCDHIIAEVMRWVDANAHYIYAFLISW